MTKKTAGAPPPLSVTVILDPLQRQHSHQRLYRCKETGEVTLASHPITLGRFILKQFQQIQTQIKNGKPHDA